jgi:hypothetical protein
MFLIGFQLIALVVNLPQRFQVINGMNATGAGMRLLPLVLLVPVASAVAATMAEKLRVHFLYTLVTGGVVTVVGESLMTTITGTNTDVGARQFVYQSLIGTGFGLMIGTAFAMVPAYMEEKDRGAKDLFYSGSGKY